MAKTVAVMQPYFFPYVGYFQLIQASDVFVFYDDVAFIKQGWINRNNLLINGQKKLFTIPVSGISSHKLIKEVEIDMAKARFDKLLKAITLAYKKAPFYNDVFPIIEKVLLSGTTKINLLAMDSVKAVCRYLQLEKVFKRSSEDFNETRELERTERLIQITRALNGDVYVNSMGGAELYDKSDFAAEGIDLRFLVPDIQPYTQFSGPFVGSLSIIDVLMFNEPGEVVKKLTSYHLTDA